ncbi:shikimate dehydrogenase [Nakamurella multipartita]|uniref:Shikimate-5-dehydrogenase n=1 Tax=Nakamurella multipartita (strain ATCC 700099 / DSM 44233 / CIP 104796 / JCM 9543 / NBRC 105858 / Y-104) TaxID=479431 RepID=C8XD21_NAKMY|nr:shikimate dehydrogenase [Nakamurella multipartita]ACV79624.1 shikimate-5-dehydrogenase [Nakamurella multipartita DSM 44233]
MSSAHRAAVVGSPVTHSLSPALHRAGYAAAGLTQWQYEPIECDAQALPDLVRSRGPEWAGFSVTMPGKSAAAAVADECSPRVQALGVANTLVRRDGGWFADNTDVDGLVGALRAAGAPPIRSALVLGGGGTAAAVLAALSELGTATVAIAGRRPSSTAGAVEVAATLGIPLRVIGWDTDVVAEAAAGVDLVVSTVPAGGADHLASALRAVPVLFDVIYHPWPTPLAAGGVPGRITVTGLDMLLHQAFRQFELITGVPAPVHAMRAGLKAGSGTDLPLPV